jgi:glutamyl-tRNA synthetase
MTQGPGQALLSVPFRYFLKRHRFERGGKGALIDGLGLKPRKAFGPIRVAVTGSTVSPPLYESMELLGRERSLHRLREARDGATRNLW